MLVHQHSTSPHKKSDKKTEAHKSAAPKTPDATPPKLGDPHQTEVSQRALILSAGPTQAQRAEAQEILSFIPKIAGQRPTAEEKKENTALSFFADRLKKGQDLSPEQKQRLAEIINSRTPLSTQVWSGLSWGLSSASSALRTGMSSAASLGGHRSTLQVSSLALHSAATAASYAAPQLEMPLRTLATIATIGSGAIGLASEADKALQGKPVNPWNVAGAATETALGVGGLTGNSVVRAAGALGSTALHATHAWQVGSSTELAGSVGSLLLQSVGGDTAQLLNTALVYSQLLNTAFDITTTIAATPREKEAFGQLVNLASEPVRTEADAEKVLDKVIHFLTSKTISALPGKSDFGKLLKTLGEAAKSAITGSARLAFAALIAPLATTGSVSGSPTLASFLMASTGIMLTTMPSGAHGQSLTEQMNTQLETMRAIQVNVTNMGIAQATQNNATLNEIQGIKTNVEALAANQTAQNAAQAAQNNATLTEIQSVKTNVEALAANQTAQNAAQAAQNDATLDAINLIKGNITETLTSMHGIQAEVQGVKTNIEGLAANQTAQNLAQAAQNNDTLTEMGRLRDGLITTLKQAEAALKQGQSASAEAVQAKEDTKQVLAIALGVAVGGLAVLGLGVGIYTMVKRGESQRAKAREAFQRDADWSGKGLAQHIHDTIAKHRPIAEANSRHALFVKHFPNESFPKAATAQKMSDTYEQLSQRFPAPVSRHDGSTSVRTAGGSLVQMAENSELDTVIAFSAQDTQSVATEMDTHVIGRANAHLQPLRELNAQTTGGTHILDQYRDLRDRFRAGASQPIVPLLTDRQYTTAVTVDEAAFPTESTVLSPVGTVAIPVKGAFETALEAFHTAMGGLPITGLDTTTITDDFLSKLQTAEENAKDVTNAAATEIQSIKTEILGLIDSSFRKEDQNKPEYTAFKKALTQSKDAKVVALGFKLLGQQNPYAVANTPVSERSQPISEGGPSATGSRRASGSTDRTASIVGLNRTPEPLISEHTV